MNLGDNCPVFLTEFDYPAKLNCNHTFCYSCLQRLIDAHQQRATNNEILNCPLCRQPADCWSWASEDAAYWKIDDIIEHRFRGRRTQYKVKWATGEVGWEPTKNLDRAPLFLAAYRLKIRRANTARWRARRREQQQNL